MNTTNNKDEREMLMNAMLAALEDDLAAGRITPAEFRRSEANVEAHFEAAVQYHVDYETTDGQRRTMGPYDTMRQAHDVASRWQDRQGVRRVELRPVAV